VSRYNWQFLLDDTDITDKIKSFTIESSLDSYCRELSFDTHDDLFYDTLDFSVIPEEPRIEVLTSIEEDEYDDPIWISQGTFFIERPTFQVGTNTTATGVWGRQSTAILGEPFAQKVTKLWNVNTTFYAICQEILESVGLTWSVERCDIQDFTIYSDNFEADDQYPIEVLKSLVELIVGEEGFVSSDRLGNIWIRRLVRTPESSDYNVTDLVVQSINEEPEWPEFGNRIKIIPAETVSQDKVDLYIENQCVGTGSSSYVDVYAQVKNGEGVPINDAVISWSFDPVIPESLWFKYPAIDKTALQNSVVMLVSNELKRATGFNSVELAFEPSSIIGIWAYADKTRTTNFAPEGGYVIDGKNVFLTEESFNYCDQQVFISYYASGMVRNTVVYNTGYVEPEGAESPYGTVIVIASVSGRESSQELYVDNSCKCQSSLTVKVDPSTITVGGGVNAKIEAYLENSGTPVEGTIRMVEMSGFGTLQWSSASTSTLATSENNEAINAVFGQTQCVVSSAISSIIGVWKIDGNNVKISGNLYSAFYGRTIDLSEYVLTGTSLVVEYNRAGSVVNYLTAVSEGVSRIDVSADVSTEEGLVQTVQVTIQAAVDPGGGEGGNGIYSVEGPSVIQAWRETGRWAWDTPFGLRGGDVNYGQDIKRTLFVEVIGGSGQLYGCDAAGKGLANPTSLPLYVGEQNQWTQTVTVKVYGDTRRDGGYVSSNVGLPSATMSVTIRGWYP
jgi:hypothetical protein